MKRVGVVTQRMGHVVDWPDTVADHTGIVHTAVADIGVDRIEGSEHTVGRSHMG